MKNRFIDAITLAFLAVIGWRIADEAFDAAKRCKDPYERAVIKQRFKRITDKIFKKSKEESC